MSDGTQSNLAIQGGTAEQRAAIAQAHVTALSYAQSGQTQAAGGQGAFATWFGPAGSAQQATVSNGFGQAVTVLQTWWIAYELETDSLPGFVYPDVYVLFEPRGPSAVHADVVPAVWTAYAVDPVDAANALALSVLHEALVQGSGGTIVDILGATEYADAAALASSDASGAAVSVRNYMAYAAGMSAGRPASPGGRGDARAVVFGAAAGLAHPFRAPRTVLPATAAMTSFGADGATVTQTAGADYSRVGHAQVAAPGGSLSLVTRSPTGRAAAMTTVLLDEEGRASTARTRKLAADGTTVAKVIDTDYRELVLGHGGALAGGKLSALVSTASGRRESASVQTFDSLGNVSTIATARYGGRGRSVVSTAATDFRAARFNASRRVENGVVASTVWRGDKTVRARSEAIFTASLTVMSSNRRYMADGKTLRHQVVVLPGKPGGPPTMSIHIDYAGARFSPGGGVAAGRVVTRVLVDGRPVVESARVYEGPGRGSTRVTKMFGSDGRTVATETVDVLAPSEVLQTRELATLADGVRLVSIEAFAYAADGKTELVHSRADYSRARLAPGNRLVGGIVAVEALRSDGVRRSRTELDFEVINREGRE